MSEDYVIMKTAAVWNAIAEGTASVLDDCGYAVDKCRPIIELTANSLTAPYVGARFAGKHAHEIWPHMQRYVPQQIASIGASAQVVDATEGILHRTLGYDLNGISRHTAKWGATSAFNVLQRLEDFLVDQAEHDRLLRISSRHAENYVTNIRRNQKQFFATSMFMYAGSAFIHEAPNIIQNILHSISNEVRRTKW